MNDPEIQVVEIDTTLLTFRLLDGRAVSVPLSFYPTLLHATPTERAHFVVYPFSVHWPDLDVDLDAECLLRGAHELPVYAQNAAHRELLVREDPPKDS
jgi:hypothetical protein